MRLSRPEQTKDRLREAMTKVGKKQIDLVRETGLNRGTISRYLSGEVEPKSDAINKLSIALDCSEMWLWGYDVPMERGSSHDKTVLTEGEKMWLEMYHRLSGETRELMIHTMGAFDRLSKDKQELALRMIRVALGDQE